MANHMKSILMPLILLSFGLLASLTATPYTESSSGIIFPDQLAGMQLAKITDYEAQTPGAGTGISYRNANAKADFYVYGGEEKNIPDNLDSESVNRHFQSVIDAIPKLLGQSENHLQILQKKEKLQIGGLVFLHIALSYQLDGTDKITHVYLTVFHHQFLKIRFTYVDATPQVNDQLLHDFLRETAKLWPSNK